MILFVVSLVAKKPPAVYYIQDFSDLVIKKQWIYVHADYLVFQVFKWGTIKHATIVGI